MSKSVTPRMTAEEHYGKPDVVRDSQGDVWVRNHQGTYDCVPVDDVFAGYTLGTIVERWGPIEFPEWHRADCGC